jgi:hypothetical protein
MSNAVMESKMKNLIVVGVALVAVLALAGCHDDNPIVRHDDDNPAVTHTPLTPQGVYTITGNHAVYIYWNGVYDSDVDQYLVYRSLDEWDNYVEVGQVAAESNPNLDLLIYEYTDSNLSNGTTYYYAVASVDHEGNVSELSAETAYDTPRPQGEVTLFPVDADSVHAGFNLETQYVVAWDNPIADIFVDRYQGIRYINVEDTMTDIMDMGYTSSFDEINVSPSVSTDTGWSYLGYYELVAGHTYVIWTRDNHFAKMRAVSLNPSSSVSFQWAYQTAVGNPELAPALNPVKRPVHGPNYGKHGAAIAVR